MNPLPFDLDDEQAFIETLQQWDKQQLIEYVVNLREIFYEERANKPANSHITAGQP